MPEMTINEQIEAFLNKVVTDAGTDVDEDIRRFHGDGQFTTRVDMVILLGKQEKLNLAKDIQSTVLNLLQQ